MILTGPLLAQVSPAASTPSPVVKTSLVATALSKLKGSLRGSDSSNSVRRSRSVESVDRGGAFAALPSSAPLPDRLADAEARVAACQQIIREKDVSIAKLQDDLKYRARRMQEQEKTVSDLRALVDTLRGRIDDLQRTIRR